MDLFEKYTPKNFTDLCTNLTANKQFLTWMKSWTEYVFRKPTPSTLLQQRDSFIKNVISKKPTAQFPLGTDWDKNRVPIPPVLIVAGPPGSGKASLVKVCSRICGYNLQVLDCSIAENYDELIKDFNNYQNNKLISFTKKQSPSAVLIPGPVNEGLSRSFLKFLVRQIKKGAIKRPVIITTEDPWTPLFVELRQNSRVLVVAENTESSSVKDRLNFIFAETLKTKSADFKIKRDLVSDLSFQYKSDIRAALNSMSMAFVSASSGSHDKDSESDYVSNLRLNLCLQHHGKTIDFDEAVPLLSGNFDDSIFKLHDDYLFQNSAQNKILQNYEIMESISKSDECRTLFQTQRSGFAAKVIGISFLYHFAQNNYSKQLRFSSKNRSKISSSNFLRLQNRNLVNSLPGFSSKTFNSRFLPEIHAILAANLHSDFIDDTVQVAKILGVEYTGSAFKPSLCEITGVVEHTLAHSSELSLRTKIAPEIKKTEKKSVKIKDIASPSKINLIDVFKVTKNVTPMTPPSPRRVKNTKLCKYKSHDGASNPVLKNITLSKFI